MTEETRQLKKWVVVQHPKHGTCIAVESDPVDLVAKINETWGKFPDRAALIAAAPDLLAACELLLAENTEEKPGCSCAVCRTIRACREAVARARGEEARP